MSQDSHWISWPKLAIMYLTKHAQNVGYAPAALASGAAGAPVHLSGRQLRDGREALRDWLGAGRNGLTVSNRSLDMAVIEIVAQVFRRSSAP
jgi:hypothetical protein